MALPTRNLDDRRFQDIVDEAKKRITISCPEWTDHNVSDPGVTLVELFAWMTEMILYRLNQVPEKNYIKFLELLGLKLREPESARAPLTFYLSAPQPQSILIPAGTEAATVRTETRPSVAFSTDQDLELEPPELMALFTREVAGKTGDKQKDHVHVLEQLGLSTFSAFHDPPAIGNALYFGFKNDLSNHVLGMELACTTAAGGGIDPYNPPWCWEAWLGAEGGQRWLPVVVEEDGTHGLNESGRILLRLPRLGQHEFIGERGYWLRCRVVKATSGSDYYHSPQIGKIDIATWGGTVWATNASVMRDEALGRSDGSPGQTFRAEHTPLLRRKREEAIQVLTPGEDKWDTWTEVPDFGDSTQQDKHYTCDSATGEIRFGPTLRLPEGRAKSFGAIPPRGAQIRFASYRYGGGVEGNVQAGALSVVKTSIPYVDRTCNHLDATGGVDPETVDLLQVRAPQLLRSSGRAVTAADFETFARTADSRVRRARCVQAAAAGQVFVLIVPQVSRPEGRISPEQLKIVDDLRDSVRRELDQRRLLTVQIDIREPEYAWVAVEISVAVDRDSDALRIQSEVERRLYAFLNPFTGGASSDGWPFGRDLYPSDVFTCLRGVQGIDYIEALRLYRVQIKTGERTEITGRLELPEHALIASAEHQVKVTLSTP